MLSCAQGVGRAVIYTAVMAAPECGMKGAYMTRVGYPQGRRGGGTGRVALAGGTTKVDVLPACGQRRATGKEGGEGPVGQGSREREGEMGVVMVGAPGVQERYVHTGKKSAQSLYIAE